MILKLSEAAPRRIWAVLAAALLAAGGCVERELYIESEPVGAEVFVDGRPRGRTPVAIPFDYYGTRLVELRLRGFEVEHSLFEVPAPWFQITPLDFFFDVLWPWTLIDRRPFLIALKPYLPSDLQEKSAILDRAAELREEAFLP